MNELLVRLTDEDVLFKSVYSKGDVSGNTLTSRVATGTAPLTVASTTVVANLNAALLNGATFAAPAAIGSGTPAAGAFTTLSASDQVTSTVSTGTAPFVVASTTVVANLNASKLGGATFAAPGAIGGTTPAAVTCTTLTTAGGLVSYGANESGGTGFRLCLVPNV